MGVTVVTTRVAMRTSNGTQDITIAGFGTPKAAMFFLNFATSDGTAADEAIFSMGMTDGTTEGCAAVFCRHGQSTMDTRRASFNDRAAGTTSGSIAVSFNSWITDGVRVDVTTTTGAVLVTVVLFTGSDLTANVHTCNPTTGGTDVTSLAARPDLLFVTGVGAADPQAQTDEAIISMGVADYNGGTERNRSVLWSSVDGGGTSATHASVREDACCGQLFSGTIQWRALADAFVATGYTMTSNADASTDEVIVLALSFGGVVDCWVGTIDTPTSTGNDAQAGPGITPQLVMMFPALLTATGTIDSAGSGTLGVSAFDDTREYCHTASDEDGQATSDTQSLSDDQAVNVPADSGAALFAGTFVSFDSGAGWTINWSDTEGSAYKWPALVIGSAAVAGGIVVLRRRRESA